MRADMQILVKSTDEATRSLVKFLNSTHTTPDIFTPAVGEIVRVGEDVTSYSIMLGDSIASGVISRMAKFEGYEVAMVDGQVVFSAGSTIPVLESSSLKLEPRVKVETDADEVPEASLHEEVIVKAEPQEAVPTVLPSRPSPQRALPSSLFVGDLRLLSLKSRLSARNIPAEFAGEGVLLCGPGVAARLSNPNADIKGGSVVAVRKVNEEEIVVEGSVSRTYYEVRKEVYGSFAQVAAA